MTLTNISPHQRSTLATCVSPDTSRLVRTNMSCTTRELLSLTTIWCANKKFQNLLLVKNKEHLLSSPVWWRSPELAREPCWSQLGFFIFWLISWRSTDQGSHFPFGDTGPSRTCSSHSGGKSGNEQAATCKVSRG